MTNACLSGHRPALLLLLAGMWLCTGFGSISVAQSCSGVLGAAVVNETFGSNGAYPLRAGQTTYQPVTTCPNDGQYLITSYFDCYSDEWHPLHEDHTPNDTKGNMLVINAAAGPGQFYSQPVQGLCYGTTYEFSVWVLNLMDTSPTNRCNAYEPVPIDPNLTMRVESPDGKVLQTINTGTLKRTSTPTWLRFATLFTLPGGNNGVVIKLINNGPGGCGNDLVIDDIQLRPCRSALQISFQTTPAASLSICAGGGAAVGSAQAAGSNPTAYQWQVSRDSISWTAIGGANNPSFSVLAGDVGSLYYRLLSAPAANGMLPSDTACSAVSNVLTVHTLVSADCSPPHFYVPDAFTPNNDGTNDRFRAYVNESTVRLDRYEMRVYDRWGSVIFASNDLTQDWDGTYTAQPCRGDVYRWVIDCQLAYGSRVTHFVKEGRVLLIR